MNTLFKLAWRNLWRSKRRTIITVASVFFGVFFAIFSSSIQKGSFENILENMVRFYSGYIQIQQKDYLDNRSLNNSFVEDETLHTILATANNITDFTARIESFALAASGDESYGAMVFGVIPENENRVSNLAHWVSAGKYFGNDLPADGILVGKQLADNLGIGVDDTLVMIGQGYHGASAAGKFRVIGLLDFPLAGLNKTMIYMELESAREFYSMPGRSTSMVIMVNNPHTIDQTLSGLKASAASDLSIYSWKEVQPELENFIQGKLAGGRIMKSILFMVIGFGIWGTVIMLMAERRREFGVMIALGIRKVRLIAIVAVESFLIGLLGVGSGALMSLPFVFYFFYNPILIGGQIKATYESMGFEPVLKFSLHPDNFYSPAITVFILFSIVTLYAVWFILRLREATAIRA
jgi:ABC-type lipoprotein release transport system permease subunit